MRVCLFFARFNQCKKFLRANFFFYKSAVKIVQTFTPQNYINFAQYFVIKTTNGDEHIQFISIYILITRNHGQNIVLASCLSRARDRKPN